MTIEIELAATNQKNPEPNLSVNGVAATLQSSNAMPNGRRLASYTFPAKALAGSNRDTIKHRDSVAITAAGERPVTVHRVEVSLRPNGSKPVQKP